VFVAPSSKVLCAATILIGVVLFMIPGAITVLLGVRVLLLEGYWAKAIVWAAPGMAVIALGFSVARIGVVTARYSRSYWQRNQPSDPTKTGKIDDK